MTTEVVFVVADIDEIVMGFGSVTLVAPDNYHSEIEAEVTGVYVHPTVAQQGIGTRIYTELEQQTRANEIQSVELSASLNAVSCVIVDDTFAIFFPKLPCDYTLSCSKLIVV